MDSPRSVITRIPSIDLSSVNGSEAIFRMRGEKVWRDADIYDIIGTPGSVSLEIQGADGEEIPIKCNSFRSNDGVKKCRSTIVTMTTAKKNRIDLFNDKMLVVSLSIEDQYVYETIVEYLQRMLPINSQCGGRKKRKRGTKRVKKHKGRKITKKRKPKRKATKKNRVSKIRKTRRR